MSEAGGCRCWIDRLDRVCRSWAGTPWQAGQCHRGTAVDCVRFVDAVLMELHGQPLPPLTRLPQDLPLHDRRGVIRAVRRMCRRYPSQTLRGDTKLELEPGDVLIVGRGRAPGHVGIVGKDTRMLWHALYGHHVCQSPVRVPGGIVLRVFRPTQKQSWCGGSLPLRAVTAGARGPCVGCGAKSRLQKVGV